MFKALTGFLTSPQDFLGTVLGFRYLNYHQFLSLRIRIPLQVATRVSLNPNPKRNLIQCPRRRSGATLEDIDLRLQAGCGGWGGLLYRGKLGLGLESGSSLIFFRGFGVFRKFRVWEPRAPGRAVDDKPKAMNSKTRGPPVSCVHPSEGNIMICPR